MNAVCHKTHKMLTGDVAYLTIVSTSYIYKLMHMSYATNLIESLVKLSW